MKRIFTIIVILLASLQAHAVLKEKDLNETLSILRSELTTYHQELGLQMQRRKEYQQRIYRQLTDVMERSNQNALMLYSQENDYIFDLTYACHEATEQYYEFQRQQTPFMAFLKQTKEDIARYDSLIVSLQTMKVNSLSRQAQQDRLVCLDLATKIRTSLVENHAQISDYISDYDYTSKRLSQLNDYAQSRYHDIQTDIFKNGGDNYFTLLKNLPMQWRRMQIAVEKKYTPSASRRSQWDSVYIFGLFVSIVIYAIIASLLNLVFFRWLLPKRFRTEEFNKKRGLTIMATTTITFAIIMGVMLATTEQNFFIMASNLLVEYAWLLGVILISLLLRVKGDQIHSAFRIYTPLLAVGFIVFAFRIILTPNELVNIAFPPILLLCTLWQWSVIRRFNKNIPRSDMFYTYISLAVLIGSTAKFLTVSGVGRRKAERYGQIFCEKISGYLADHPDEEKAPGTSPSSLQSQLDSFREMAVGRKPSAPPAKWSDEEESRLSSEFSQGMTIAQIAALHKRTPGAIRARLKKMGLIA